MSKLFAQKASSSSVAKTISKKKTPPKLPPDPVYAKSFITHTFSECVENHAGMKKLGTKAERGFTAEHLEACVRKHGGELRDMRFENKRAVVLVFRDGVNRLLGSNDAADRMHAESWSQQFDRKMYNSRQDVVQNKWGRYNNLYADEAQDPDWDNKLGRVIAFRDAPMMAALRARLPEFLGDQAKDLYAETNLYPNVEDKKVGIGFHGDTERSIVVGVRLGKQVQLPLRYQWFRGAAPVSDEHVIELNHGDIYAMSFEAVGQNWLTAKKDEAHPRHAVGLKQPPRAIGVKKSDMKKNK